MRGRKKITKEKIKSVKRQIKKSEENSFVAPVFSRLTENENRKPAVTKAITTTGEDAKTVEKKEKISNKENPYEGVFSGNMRDKIALVFWLIIFFLASFFAPIYLYWKGVFSMFSSHHSHRYFSRDLKTVGDDNQEKRTGFKTEEKKSDNKQRENNQSEEKIIIAQPSSDFGSATVLSKEDIFSAEKVERKTAYIKSVYRTENGKLVDLDFVSLIGKNGCEKSVKEKCVFEVVNSSDKLTSLRLAWNFKSYLFYPDKAEGVSGAMKETNFDQLSEWVNYGKGENLFYVWVVKNGSNMQIERIEEIVH